MGSAGDAGLLAPPQPGEGIQYRMIADIPPGVESYGCQLVKAPPGGLFVQREAVQFSQGGHHVLLYRTPYLSIPTTDERGEALDAEALHDCSDGATARWRVNGVVGGSESFGGEGLVSELPPGVALIIEPGAVLLMSTHYLNATSSLISVDSRINLYTIPEEQVVIEAGVLYLDNQVLRVPAHGASSARMRCPIDRDISLIGSQSHMHSRGTLMRAVATGGNTEDLAPLYETISWSEPAVKRFDPPLLLAAGSAVETRCDYASTEDRDVFWGLTSADEMCQLIGPYFPRDEGLETCRDEAGEIAATWIGEGDSTCAEAWACMKAADPREDRDTHASCIVSTCPEVAEEVSAVARCQLSFGHGACAKECASLGSACANCLCNACSSVVDACEKAKCGNGK